MEVSELEKRIKSGKLDAIYLLYGNELYLLESVLKKIKNLFGEAIKGINYVVIDETNIGELIANIETPAFGYEKKLIIVKNAGMFKKEGKRKTGNNHTELIEAVTQYLEKHLNIIQESDILIFVEEEAEKNGLYQFIEKNGVLCHFEAQKLPELMARMKAICTAYQVKIDDMTVKYFIECCGTNMQDLINEIRKLIEYVGQQGIITKEDIDLLSTKQMESIIFDLTDNLGKKNIPKALEILNGLLTNKEPIQKILVTLYNHFKKLYIVKEAIDTNQNLATSLNLKPNQMFLTTKYKMQAGYFQKLELRKMIEELIDLDYHYKIGLIDINIGLEAILCRYCS